jgi:hypothetical protein
MEAIGTLFLNFGLVIISGLRAWADCYWRAALAFYNDEMMIMIMIMMMMMMIHLLVEHPGAHVRDFLAFGVLKYRKIGLYPVMFWFCDRRSPYGICLEELEWDLSKRKLSIRLL